MLKNRKKLQKFFTPFILSKFQFSIVFFFLFLRKSSILEFNFYFFWAPVAIRASLVSFESHWWCRDRSRQNSFLRFPESRKNCHRNSCDQKRCDHCNSRRNSCVCRWNPSSRHDLSRRNFACSPAEPFCRSRRSCACCPGNRRLPRCRSRRNYVLCLLRDLVWTN